MLIGKWIQLTECQGLFTVLLKGFGWGRHFKMYLKEKFGWIKLKSTFIKKENLFFINLVVDNI